MDLNDIADYRKTERVFLPDGDDGYEKYYKEWQRAIEKCVCG